MLIVGAGITGLTLAYALRLQGTDSIVVESTARSGGAIHSELRDGFFLEWGPSTLRGTIPELGWLLERLQLRDSVVPLTPGSRRRYVADTDLRLRRLGPSLLPSLAREPANMWRGMRTLSQAPWRNPEAIDANLSLHGWVHQRFGRFAADTLAQGFCHGLYGRDADQLDARFVLTRPERMRPTPVGQWELPKSFWLQRGLSTLTHALAQDCEIHLNSRQSLSQLMERFRPQATVLTSSWWSTQALLAEFGITFAFDLVTPSSMEIHYLVWSKAPWHLERSHRWLSRSFGLVTSRSDAQLLGMHVVSSTTPQRVPEGAALVALYCRGGTTADQGLKECTSLVGRLPAPDTIWSDTVAHPMPAVSPGYMPQLATLHESLAANREIGTPIYLAGSFCGGVGVPSRVRAALHCAQRLGSDVQNHI